MALKSHLWWTSYQFFQNNWQYSTQLLTNAIGMNALLTMYCALCTCMKKKLHFRQFFAPIWTEHKTETETVSVEVLRLELLLCWEWILLHNLFQNIIGATEVPSKYNFILTFQEVIVIVNIVLGDCKAVTLYKQNPMQFNTVHHRSHPV